MRELEKREQAMFNMADKDGLHRLLMWLNGDDRRMMADMAHIAGFIAGLEAGSREREILELLYGHAMHRKGWSAADLAMEKRGGGRERNEQNESDRLNEVDSMKKMIMTKRIRYAKNGKMGAVVDNINGDDTKKYGAVIAAAPIISIWFKTLGEAEKFMAEQGYIPTGRIDVIDECET